MKLNKRITIETCQEVENEVGEMVKEWTEYKKLWASKTQLKAIDKYNDKESIEYVYRFKVRYREDLDEKMRIVYKGVIYDIKHINNINEPSINLYETHIDCTHYKEGTYNE